MTWWFFCFFCCFPGSMPGTGGPENVTVELISPSSAKVSWVTNMDNVEKYDVNFRPTNARYVWVCKRKLLYCLFFIFVFILCIIVVYYLFNFIFLLPVHCPVFITHSSTYCSSFLPLTISNSFTHSCIHSAVCLATDTQSFPKRVLHRGLSSASSFSFHYPVVSSRSSGSCLRLLPRPSVTLSFYASSLQ